MRLSELALTRFRGVLVPMELGGPTVLWSCFHASTESLDLYRAHKPMLVQPSPLNLPLKPSMLAFCTGFPGSPKRSPTRLA